MKPFNIREYRCSKYIVALIAFSGIAMPLSAIGIYQKNGLTWLCLTAICISPFGIVAVITALTAKVQITETQLIVRSDFRTRVYSKSLFSGVFQARGCALGLTFIEGGMLELPYWLNHNAANALRAWVKPVASKSARLQS